MKKYENNVTYVCIDLIYRVSLILSCKFKSERSWECSADCLTLDFVFLTRLIKSFSEILIELAFFLEYAFFKSVAIPFLGLKKLNLEFWVLMLVTNLCTVCFDLWRSAAIYCEGLEFPKHTFLNSARDPHIIRLSKFAFLLKSFSLLILSELKN